VSNYLIKKLKGRYNQFVNHPLVNYPIFGLIKYIYINLKIRLYHKPILIKWLNGLKYYLSIGDSGIIGNYYFVIDDYEESIFLINYLTEQDTFVDVGANHGHYTMIANGICRSKSLSIEPIHQTFERLKMNIELNKLINVKLFNVGISDMEGELLFSNNRNSMNRVIDEDFIDDCETVEVKTLDNLLISEEKINVIKIDVEGYEKKVLIGAREILKNQSLNVIIIELNDRNLEYDYNEQDILLILKKNGFFPYKYVYPDNVLVPLEKKNFDSFNTIFIRDIDLVNDRINQKLLTIKGNELKVRLIIE